MKTLIFNGSPRKHGDTMSVINRFIDKLSGEYRIVNAYDCDIKPCIDCRYCWEHEGCSMKDGMQDIYSYIQECDNILIASPIYFSELTGKLLDVGSRLQTYFCGTFFRKEEVIKKKKKGAIILVGGGDGNFNKAYDTAKVLLHHMNSYDIYRLVAYHDTNHHKAIESDTFLKDVEEITSFFNDSYSVNN